MRVIINDLEHPGDVLAAIAAVAYTLADPLAWDLDEHVFFKTAQTELDPESPSCPTDEQAVAIQVDDVIGGLRFVPCTSRGRHRRLVECWMCWADVHRGACRLDQAVNNAD